MKDTSKDLKIVTVLCQYGYDVLESVSLYGMLNLSYRRRPGVGGLYLLGSCNEQDKEAVRKFEC